MDEIKSDAQESEPLRRGRGRPRKYDKPVNAGLFWEDRHQKLWAATATHTGKTKPQVLAEALEAYARAQGVPEPEPEAITAETEAALDVEEEATEAKVTQELEAAKKDLLK